MKKLWTAEELQYLQDNYFVLGPTGCAKNLQGRTPLSTCKKATSLGFTTKIGKTKTHEDYELELFEKEINYIPLERYISTDTPILHECIEGHQRKIAPSNVLKSKTCPLCAGISKKSTETYTKEVSSKGIWPTEPYVNARTSIWHKCLNNHTFKSSPTSLLKNLGCPVCSKQGFDASKPAILYYVRIAKNHETYYKLGITNRTVLLRFRDDTDKDITILKQIYFDIGLDAKLEETRLLNKFKEKRVYIKNFLKSGGNSELFEYDIEPFQ